ncbi:MAG: 5'-methylthioadenosine/adenosylhomocysteine nucleosidase [Clostridia bacterium]|nr:5'-methylthioadenosine/adenosylhomocysteine nucleosidase [Clostridia bacterium]
MIDIGIIGAMDVEVNALASMLEDKKTERFLGLEFNTGALLGKKIAIVKCGIGKVFAAMSASAMIARYSPRLIVNTGVGGALSSGLSPTDTVIAERLVQHDMDTSALGDAKGLVSGINKIYFEADARANEILLKSAEKLSLKARLGTVASGDKFVAEKCEKERIVREFSANVCEMEGAAIAQVAFVNNTPFAVVRAISDSADETSSMDYMEFLPIAAKNSANLTLALIKEY